jgi:single-strand DNA-binding protein
MTRDPEVRYTQAAEPMAICRFSIAVDRPYSKDREKTADFLNCVCFGKRGESIGKYFTKGNRIAVTGRLQVSDWTDNSGNKRYSTDVIVEEFEFCESKNQSSATGDTAGNEDYGFHPVEDDDDRVPF